ncbi:MAG: YfiR family protein [Gammaproteobacteria bacterium]
MDQRELTIKAAYLFRLSLFVEWPSSNLISTGKEPLFFCVADARHISRSMETLLANKTINQHKIVVTEVSLQDDLSFCHLLYLPEHIQTPQLFLHAASGYPILTVGESKTFFRHGGMIFLFNKDNRIHFAINERAAKGVGLEFRAQLLKLAVQLP